MANSTNHIPKKQLLEFININLYVDDMIAIDRHLETCDKCKRHHDKLIGYSGSKQTLITQYKYLIISILIIIVLILIGYIIKNNFLTINSTNNTEVINSNTMLTQDSSLTDTLVAQNLSEDGVNKPRDTHSISSANVNLNQDEVESVIETNNALEPEPIENEINQNTSISPESQTASEEAVDNERGISQPPVEPEEAPETFAFNITPTTEKLAAPIMGYPSYSNYLTQNLDQLILPINGVEESLLVLSFEIQEDQSLSNFVIKNSSNTMYAESMIEVIKNGPKWKPYNALEDSTIIITHAEVSIKMSN